MKNDHIEFLKSWTSERIREFPKPKVLYTFLGIIESDHAEIDELKIRVQSLQDEINHLKGEKGKPNFNKKKSKPKIFSSEEERKTSDPNSKKGRVERNSKVEITREEVCLVDRSILPPDAIFKGYSSATVQDIKIVPDNVHFLIEQYYSPSEKKTYSGKRPDGYEGDFGPGVKSFIINLKYGCNMSEPAIHSFFSICNVHISVSTISRILTQNIDQFHQEKDEVTYFGLFSTNFQQMDDTSSRVNGELWYTQILCNQYYSSFATIPNKDRLSILRLLIGPQELKFNFNDESFALLEKLKISVAIINHLKKNCYNKIFSESQLDEVLLNLPTTNKAIGTIHRRIKEAAGIAWYHNQEDWPVIEHLLTDDAPQFDHIAFGHALCWVHAGRHLKKLNPLIPAFQEILKNQLSIFWDYYHQLLEFKKNPSNEMVQFLENRFDEIFSIETGYQALDDRMNAILKNKDKLLLVLKCPQIPLHNNESELAARAQVRRRDVSLHTKSTLGTKAADTFLSLKETARKCGVDFFQYLYDRFTKKGEIERLGLTLLRKAGYDPSLFPTRL